MESTFKLPYTDDETTQRGDYVVQEEDLRRFERITDDVKEWEAFSKLLVEKGLTRADLGCILFSIRVRPGIDRACFGHEWLNAP